MLFVQPVAAETTKGGDGKLTDMLFASEKLDDSYFENTALILENLEGTIERIEAWMYQRYYYGFNEYYSNNYYPEDIAPMANFIQFAEDSESVRRMKIIMDLIRLDIATQSYKYTDENGMAQYAFVSASGRMYMDNKCSDDTGNRLRPYINMVLENGEEYKTVSNRFLVCFRRMYEAEENGEPIYRVPEVIKSIFDDPATTQIIKSSNGITLEELVEDSFVGEEVGQIMMQMGMEAFSNPIK